MRRALASLAASIGIAALAPTAAAQTSSFSYQGNLVDNGVPADGFYDFRFRLYTDGIPGAPDTQIGTDVFRSTVKCTDGLFTTPVDFGASAFDGPGLQYLEIAVSPLAAGTYTTLSGRQWITTAPTALRASFANVANSAATADFATAANTATFADNLNLPFGGLTGTPVFPGGPVFDITNGGPDGYGIYATGPTGGLIGWGGPFTSGFPALTTGFGVAGISNTAGLIGSSTNGYGVRGLSSNGTGGYFDNRTNSASDYALHARSNFGSTAGLFETNLSSSARPTLIATSNATVSSAYAVHGIIESTSPGGFSSAIRGENRGTAGSGIGVWGTQAGTGYGVYGTSQGGLGVYGVSDGTSFTGFNAGVRGQGSGGALAGYFSGNVHIAGTLSKSAGTFKIDHPQDPENRTLSHSFVESPEMKNIYDGLVTTNAKGHATVTLPAYFNALNSAFRYQLTVIDASDDFVLVKVTHQIGSRTTGDTAFAVRTSKPHTQLSWQVTGVRDDPYAQQNPIAVEAEKSDADKGRYLNPEAYNQPPESGIGFLDPSATQHPQPNN